MNYINYFICSNFQNRSGFPILWRTKSFLCRCLASEKCSFLWYLSPSFSLLLILQRVKKGDEKLRESCLLWFQRSGTAPLSSLPAETTGLRGGGASRSPGSATATQTVATPSTSCRTAPGEAALERNSPVQTGAASGNRSGELGFKHRGRADSHIRHNCHRA